MHELVYGDHCSSVEELEKRLKESKPGGVCDPELNEDIYLLAKDLKAELIGIDNGDTLPSTVKGAERFIAREQHMLEKILKVVTKATDKVVVVVVGDTHLRTKPHEDLTEPSCIYTSLKDQHRVIIKRAPKAFREVD